MSEFLWFCGFTLDFPIKSPSFSVCLGPHAAWLHVFPFPADEFPLLPLKAACLMLPYPSTLPEVQGCLRHHLPSFTIIYHHGPPDEW